MNCFCVKPLKDFVTFLNFICWMCAILVVGFGEFQIIHSRYLSLIPPFCPLYPGNTLVVTGTMATCVCYLGVLGAMRENRCMLITFFLLMFVLMLVELAMACMFLVYEREMDHFFEGDLMRSLEIYRNSTSDGSLTIKEDFDAVQHTFRCCGVHNVSDWEGNVPVSCCTQDPCTFIPYPNWKEGCHMMLRNWFARNLLSTGSGVVSLFILQNLLRTESTSIFKSNEKYVLHTTNG
ncbi:hypothetical protein DPEC_G00122540 [Dallia pectoralis]|uniref:Uncharacterized protein n=1 Tax=Dallia pectoralis TaxID=75939 RepID=A0ACC2GQA5_DALPE|nr:hypothetical protein DPEC_G00122540 [Dallia pectoralis]